MQAAGFVCICFPVGVWEALPLCFLTDTETHWWAERREQQGAEGKPYLKGRLGTGGLLPSTRPLPPGSSL